MFHGITPFASPSYIWVVGTDLEKIASADLPVLCGKNGRQDHIIAILTQIIASFGELCHDLVSIPGFSGRNPYHTAGRFLPKGRLAETACLLRQLYDIFPENPGMDNMGATNCQDGYFS